MDWTGHIIEVDEESLRRREGAAGFQRLLDDLNRGFHARAVLAEASVRAERARLEAAPLVMNEGNMRARLCVSGADYHWWGQRVGYECWEDEEWLREYERDNPECRVRQRMGVVRVGRGKWEGGSGNGRNGQNGEDTGRLEGDPTGKRLVGRDADPTREAA